MESYAAVRSQPTYLFAERMHVGQIRRSRRGRCGSSSALCGARDPFRIGSQRGRRATGQQRRDPTRWMPEGSCATSPDAPAHAPFAAPPCASSARRSAVRHVRQNIAQHSGQALKCSAALPTMFGAIQGLLDILIPEVAPIGIRRGGGDVAPSCGGFGDMRWLGHARVHGHPARSSKTASSRPP